MARPLRIEYAGAHYHVTSRGNERKAIFRDDIDREKFLELIERAVEQFDIRVHAYVLMENHYHPLLMGLREIGSGWGCISARGATPFSGWPIIPLARRRRRRES